MFLLIRPLFPCSDIDSQKGNGCNANTSIMYVLEFLCKVDFANDKFIHDTMYTYHKVMRLAEFAKVMEHS